MASARKFLHSFTLGRIPLYSDRRPHGYHKNLSSSLRQFFWEGMHRDVCCYVTNCLTCQQMKNDNRKPIDLLQPLPTPIGIWEDLSLDFITGLPQSQWYTTILLVVNRYSKGSHFRALPPRHSADMVALLFIEIICKLHGFPRSLVSDRDPLFVSTF